MSVFVERRRKAEEMPIATSCKNARLLGRCSISPKTECVCWYYNDASTICSVFAWKSLGRREGNKAANAEAGRHQEAQRVPFWRASL